MTPDQHSPTRCAVCAQRFDADQWANRHWSGPDRDEVHEQCCGTCRGEQ